MTSIQKIIDGAKDSYKRNLTTAACSSDMQKVFAYIKGKKIDDTALLPQPSDDTIPENTVGWFQGMLKEVVTENGITTTTYYNIGATFADSTDPTYIYGIVIFYKRFKTGQTCCITNPVGGCICDGVTACILTIVANKATGEPVEGVSIPEDVMNNALNSLPIVETTTTPTYVISGTTLLVGGLVGLGLLYLLFKD